MLGDMMEGIRRFRSRDGVEIVAEDIGPRGAPVAVLMHGGGQTRHSWSGAVKALANSGYRVINLDLRGHGDSGWSETGAYHLDDRVADLRAIVAELTMPFALVGASLGGAVAIHAVAAGVTPAAVVLVDIVPEPEKVGVDRVVNFMRANSDGFASLDEVVEAIAAYNPSRSRPSNPSGLMRNLRTGNGGRLYWHWDPRIIQHPPAVHHAIVRESAKVMAARDGLPVLLVRGLQSDIVSDANIAAFKAVIPSLEVADVGGAGHMVAGDHNDAFNESVLAFLDCYIGNERV